MDKGGIRIQKVLSENGIMSRRAAEDAITKGRITVNGHPCTLGQKINTRKDIVALDGVNLKLAKAGQEEKLYIMLNKPRGYVTTTSDELGRRCVTDLLTGVNQRVYPVGRLDKISEGLLLFTNDGALANAVMHPGSGIAKTYRVTIRPSITEEQIIHLSTGVEIDGKKTLPAQVHVLSNEPGRVVMLMTIYEGRNRQIRKMCEAVGVEVARLKRISVGPLQLGMLQPGQWRELKPSELTALRNSLTKASNRAEARRNEEKLAIARESDPASRTGSWGKAKPAKRAFDERSGRSTGYRSGERSSSRSRTPREK
ncbi:pseudouridine synthase [Oscillospiraceae bacterium MB08-C2-2]|nr:pseudouridine synthase [Oscillospiraceae bacterium MB08-C2-2]